jgi:hemolysin activation/secretion protein
LSLSSLNIIRPALQRPAALALLGLSLCQPAWAATPVPDAGQILHNITPLPPAVPEAPANVLPPVSVAEPPTDTASTTVIVDAFQISGATVFTEAQLQALLQDALHQPLSLSTMQRYLNRIDEFYHRHGYLLARAMLPPQQIQHGIVQIRVLEGRLGQVRLDNHSLVNDAALKRQLQQTPGQSVQASALYRDLLQLNDLPGVAVRSSLRPGTTVGSTDLLIMAVPESRVGGQVVYDNGGIRSTGVNRLSGAVMVNSPSGQGDRLLLQWLAAQGLDYLHLDYQLPVSRVGTQLKLASSWLTYRLGGDFRPLRAQGAASDYSVAAWQPLWRDREGRLDTEVTLARKRLHDSYELAVVALKYLDTLHWRLDGQYGSGQRVDNGSIGVSVGRLQLDEANAVNDAVGHRTAGHYVKINGQWTGQQRLNRTWLGSVRLEGQWASRNLDSTEKMGLGGANAVRAYAPNEYAADVALLLRVDVRYLLNAAWRIGLFVDAAHGQWYRQPLASDPVNHGRLFGEGVSVDWSRRQVVLSGFAAWRSGVAPVTTVEDKPLLGVQLAVGF